MMLDVTDRQIVVIGGGGVASRKVAGLMAAGARQIKVISTEFRAEMAGDIHRFTRPYHPDDLLGAQLVFACTDSSVVNDQIVRDCRSAGILVCRADGSDESPGDFSTPAKFQAGAVTVTVSAQSAALAAAIRDDLQRGFDPQWAAMADAMQTLRPLIKSSNFSPTERAGLFRKLASPQARRILSESGFDGLKNWILNRPTPTF